VTRLINPTRGFKTLPTASATIKGFEVMRTIRKRRCLMLESGTALCERRSVSPLDPRLGMGRMRMGLPMPILEISGGFWLTLRRRAVAKSFKKGKDYGKST
jgi:hypothetical protein